jgi:hypothetical protein
MERARDRFLEGFAGLPHCVETWHLGNLAYAWENDAVPEVLRCMGLPLVTFALSIDPSFVFLDRVCVPCAA